MSPDFVLACRKGGQDMTQTDTLFAGSIPDLYDSHLVPLIFESYADDRAARGAERAPHAVLETAAGSGVVTRALAPRLAGDACYLVTDLNQPMLDRAMSQQPPDDRIAWRQADATALPFEAGEFDAVLCQFGAMFFPDRVLGYREARRVLRPGGVFAFNVWDRIETNAFPDVVTAALAGLYPDDPPRFLARTPHGYHDKDVIAADLRAAGFGRFEITTVTHTSRADSARVPVVAYCQGTPLRNEIDARDASRLDEATACAADAIARKHGAGEVAAKIQGHVITAAS